MENDIITKDDSRENEAPITFKYPEGDNESSLKQALQKKDAIDEEGNVALTDEDDVVIAEARMLFMDKKIAIDPLDKESENVFITKRFKIVRSEEFDINAFN